MNNEPKGIYANTYFEGLKKCFSCKYRFRKITGGCAFVTVGSATYQQEDDMYSCERYEPLKKEELQ